MTNEAELREEINRLKVELGRYTRDGLEGLYHALNYQLNCLSDELRGNYVSLNTKTDKTFERIWKAMVDSKDVAQNMQWLKKELKIKQDGETAERSSTEEDEPRYTGSPIEAAAFKKRDEDR